MKPQNETPTPELNPQQQEPSVTSPSGLSRRKFLSRAGVAGSLPVIMSLQSGSAWGCVDLLCSPGHNSLSNTQSAVSSALAQKGNAHLKKPNWSKISTIQNVLSVDFDKYLLKDFYRGHNIAPYRLPFLYYLDRNGKYIELNSFNDENQLAQWSLATNQQLYSKSQLGRYSKYSGLTEDRLPRSFPEQVIKPVVWNNKIVKTGLSLSHLLPGMAGELSSTTLDTHAQRHIIAAFIGALWERQVEYTIARKIPDKTLCYPTPEEIRAVYNKVRTNTTKLSDMENLFAYYSTGKV
jgi:hypothetical protein